MLAHPCNFHALLTMKMQPEKRKITVSSNYYFQEPGANASEIFAVLKHVRPGDDFVPNFEMFAKSDVSI